jgi:DNA-binding response OmpR family regulator
MTWPQYKRKECTFKGTIVKLTNHEIEILSVLMMNHPRPVTRDHLIESLYLYNDNEPDFSENCINQFITRLRNKLGKRIIINRRMIGFSLNYN